ncbi:MAG: hypothetical protein FWF02_11515 [Micrococcales bacterium]|nr:hypothetical protein [Micrococcales bacterium]MCL2668314.1 hypothetical protein [Micrococcales bacterium]
MTRALTTRVLTVLNKARHDDTGDGTLSTVIIIAGFVTLALLIVGLVTQVAQNYMDQIR